MVFAHYLHTPRLVYVFRVMTCDAYYDEHDDPPAGRDRCSVNKIESRTSRELALLAGTTTFFGLANLFVTGWLIKKIGVKSALLIQVFWPAVRLLVQNIGVTVGKNAGIMIVQSSQIITIVGGPNGYLLALNSFVSEVVGTKDRTGSLGRLQGSQFFGTSIGYLLGGLIGDHFGIVWPFRVAGLLFFTSTLYVLLVLPKIPPISEDSDTKQPQGLARLVGPFKVFTPRKWVLQDGRVRREYGALLLGIGVYFGVLATGFIPFLLQMYGTDVFGFGQKHNSYMVSLNAMLRGLFLTLLFPRIIALGRGWMTRRHSAVLIPGPLTPARARRGSEYLPTSPGEIQVADALDQQHVPVDPPEPQEEDDSLEFDLLYCKGSLLADGILTGAASLINRSWQMYLVAGLLPFAAGTGSSSKGTILNMCMPSERVDALSAITLIENMARLSTTAVFGLIYAAFAEIGKNYLVFICNAVSLPVIVVPLRPI